MYLKDIDPKLAQKKPLTKRIRDWVSDSLSSSMPADVRAYLSSVK